MHSALKISDSRQFSRWIVFGLELPSVDVEKGVIAPLHLCSLNGLGVCCQLVLSCLRDSLASFAAI